jgi:hypothetical protein
MSGRHHLRRASSEFLNAGGSVFDLFIGQMLRERYALPRQVPQDMRRLLAQLDKQRTVVQTSQLRQRSERAPAEANHQPEWHSVRCGDPDGSIVD